MEYEVNSKVVIPEEIWDKYSEAELVQIKAALSRIVDLMGSIVFLPVAYGPPAFDVLGLCETVMEGLGYIFLAVAGDLQELHEAGVIDLGLEEISEQEKVEIYARYWSMVNQYKKRMASD